MEVYTQNKEETRALGQVLGTRLIQGKRGERAKIMALYGELGSGKTMFVQGLAKGIGIPHRILSPTFILVRRYGLAGKNFSWFYHIDLYRLDKRADFRDLGIIEIFQDPGAIVAIEWAERLGDLLPKECIQVSCYEKSDIKRVINIENE